jgi:hypothetical protein
LGMGWTVTKLEDDGKGEMWCDGSIFGEAFQPPGLALFATVEDILLLTAACLFCACVCSTLFVVVFLVVLDDVDARVIAEPGAFQMFLDALDGDIGIDDEAGDFHGIGADAIAVAMAESEPSERLVQFFFQCV